MSTWDEPKSWKLVPFSQQNWFRERWPEGCTRNCQDHYGVGCGDCDAFKSDFDVAHEAFVQKLVTCPEFIAETVLVDSELPPVALQLVSQDIAHKCAADEAWRDAIGSHKYLREQAGYMLMNANRMLVERLEDCA